MLILFHIWLVVQATQSTLQAKQLPSPRFSNILHVHKVLLQVKLLPIPAVNMELTYLQIL
jgi:hypothetical protein